MRDDEILGLGLIGGAVAYHMHKKNETKKAAEAEGITYDEMKLRQKAAHNHEKATTAKTARGRRKAEAKAVACEEQLAKFEETRKMEINQ